MMQVSYHPAGFTFFRFKNRSRAYHTLECGWLGGMAVLVDTLRAGRWVLRVSLRSPQPGNRLDNPLDKSLTRRR